jgi:hypothetical protein
MRRMRLPKVSALALLMLLFWLPMAGAQDTATEVGTDIGTLYRDEAVPLYKAPAYSPYADRDYPRRVLWGDTHLHTANSLDAAAFGNTLGPEPAGRAHLGAEHEADDRRLSVRSRALHNRCGPCSQRHLPLPMLSAIHGLGLPAIHDLSSNSRSPGRDAHFLQCTFRLRWNGLSAVLPELRFRRDKWKRGRSGNSGRLGGHARRAFTLQSNCRVVLRPRPIVASACWSATTVPWNARLGAIRHSPADAP